MIRLLFFCIFPFAIHGQTNTDVIGLKIGYSATNIIFKEAFEPSVNIFGRNFNTGKTFVGDGIELGVSKSVNAKLFIDLSFSTFSGRDTKLRVNNNENWYTLRGFQIPITANHLFRDYQKRLRIDIGAGFQYLKGRLKQFETISDTSVQVTSQTAEINISEFQFSARGGIQFHLIPNLFLSFIVKVSISTNGRYSDNPCISIKYYFKK